MSVKIIFVRHGQSSANKSGVFYDSPGCELTGIGKFQAELAGLELGRSIENASAVYCSPYKRAKQTCEIAMRESGIECRRGVIFDKRIRERGFNGLIGRSIGENGDIRNGAVSTEDYQKIWTYGDPIQERLRIETLKTLRSRVMDFLRCISGKHQNGTVIVFSHGGVGRMMWALCNEWPEEGHLYVISFMFNCDVLTFQI